MSGVGGVWVGKPGFGLLALSLPLQVTGDSARAEAGSPGQKAGARMNDTIVTQLKRVWDRKSKDSL